MGGSLGKTILIGAGGLVALVILVAAGLVLFFPKAAALAEVERQVERATQRRLDVASDVSVTIWPALGFSAQGVTLSNPPGYGDAPFLTARRVVFAVAVLPLLGGDIQVRRLYLDEPVLDLVARADGHGNWELPAAETPQNPDQQIKTLRLEDVRVTDGRLSFHGPVGEPLVVTNVNATMTLNSLDAPAETRGDFRYRDQPLNFDATIGTPRAMLTGAATPLSVAVTGALLHANFEGVYDSKTGRVRGNGSAEGNSLRDLLAWQGAPLGPGGGFGAFRGQATIQQTADTLRLTQGAFDVDALHATGQLVIGATADGRMAVSGALAAPALDANPYITPTGAPGGVTASTAWSEDPLDLSGLKAADLDLNLTLGALTFERMRFTNAAMILRVRDGVADARLTRVALYEGTGTARIIADGRDSAARIAISLDAQNVQALPLLTDAIGFDKIQGRGRLTASLAGQGATQAALMHALRGSASFNFNDGAWRGVNLAQVARTVQAALSGASVGAAATTDFAELSATFAVTNGVAATQDIKMLNPYVRLDGKGLIDIGSQTLDLRLAPRAVRSAQGQGGDASVTGIGVPFRVNGPWAAPHFAADLEDVLRSQVQAQINRAVRGGSLGDLGALIGGASPAAPAPASGATETPATPPARTPSVADRARDALDGLLHRR